MTKLDPHADSQKCCQYEMRTRGYHASYLYGNFLGLIGYDKHHNDYVRHHAGSLIAERYRRANGGDKFTTLGRFLQTSGTLPTRAGTANRQVAQIRRYSQSKEIFRTDISTDHLRNAAISVENYSNCSIFARN